MGVLGLVAGVLSLGIVFLPTSSCSRDFEPHTRTESSRMGVRCGYPVVFSMFSLFLARIAFQQFPMKIESQPNQT